MGKPTGFTPNPYFAASEGPPILARKRCCLYRKDRADAPKSRCPAPTGIRSKLVPSALRDQGQ